MARKNYLDRIFGRWGLSDDHTSINDPSDSLKCLIVPGGGIKGVYDLCKARTKERKQERETGERTYPVFLVRDMIAGGLLLTFDAIELTGMGVLAKIAYNSLG